MISHKHKFIFIHIPKTAGTSIEEALRDESCQLLPDEWDYSRAGHAPLNHLTLQEVADYGILTPAQIKAYFKFCFVRNPWDRLISEIFCPWMSPWFKDLTVDQRIRSACDWATTPIGIANHLRVQQDFVHADGLQMDFIGRFEHLEEDFGQLCRLLGIDAMLPHRNRSAHRPYQEYYDAETQALTAATYRRDIDAFHYRFGEAVGGRVFVQATPRQGDGGEKGSEKMFAPLPTPKLEKAVPQVSQSKALKHRPIHDQPVIWLVGDGRSGTTWLADLINYRQNYRFMFEPLSPWSCDFLSLQNLYLYLRPQEGQAYAPKFQQIFSGQLRHPRIDQYTTSGGNDKGLLIKDILGHLCLKWVDEQFPQVKKILLLRHPFAVALSKIRMSQQHGWHWLQEPERLFAQSQLYEDFLQPFADIVPLASSNFEKQVLIWSILHYIPLMQLNQEQIHLVYYEELCTNFENEMGRLLAYLGEGQPTLDERLLKLQGRPSIMATGFSAISQQRNLIDGWVQQLTSEQIDKGEYILNAFGLAEIYNGHNLRPDPEAAAYFLKTSGDGGRVVVRETPRKVDERARRFSTTMKITAYPLYDHAIPLQPAAEEWGKLGPGPTQNPAYPNLDLASAARQGWQLRCPVAFTATWNGGPNAADIEIRLAEDATAQAAFVQSHLGDGLLTFYPGYQFKTDGEHLLWVRGAINAPKDGLYPLERMVDTSMLPCTIAIHWKFTRPHQTIRFAAGEPFATLLLYPKAGLENVRVEVIQADEGEDTYAQAFQQMSDDPAVQSLFQRLAATLTQPTEDEPNPQKG